MTDLAPIAVTMGEPAGVGGDIITSLYHQISRQRQNQAEWQSFPCFYCLDDPDRLRQIADHFEYECPIEVIGKPEEANQAWLSGLPVLPLAQKVQWQPGLALPENGAAVIEAIDLAVAHVQVHQAAALVTNPIHKHNLHQAGFLFPGHTEYLAHLAGDIPVAMMIAAPGLKVVPLTIHIALSDVPRAVTPDLLESQIQIVTQALQKFWSLPRPRIAITGLNPHAGEDGSMGQEEITWIQNKIVEIQNNIGTDHLCLRGPLPADTLFHAAARENYDAVIGMYHDQVLTPVKMLDFDHGVNITLGLPFIRTSPDHGTAFNIAGTGKAKISSTACAIKQAAEMALCQKQSL